MTENVKIKIHEHDNTSPSGSGIDSTDIAFVPGFSVLENAPKNKPTLVTNVRDFEKLFGDKPRVLTYQDTENYQTYEFKAGNIDRSYVYAKELLYQGMPILYANIVDEGMYKGLTLNEKLNLNKTYKGLTIELLDNKNTIRLSSTIDRTKETVEFDLGTGYTITLEEGTSSKTCTFEYVLRPASDACEILDCDVDPESFKNNADIVVTKLSNTQYDFLASGNEEIDNINIKVTANITLKAGEYVDIDVYQVTKSALNVFYGENSIINNCWAISTIENPVNDTISDKSVYSVKYITSGGYPSAVKSKTDNKSIIDMFATDMIDAAAHRGDAVALIDYQLDSDRTIFSIGSESDSFYAQMHKTFGSVSDPEYGTVMYPWSTYNCGSTLKDTPIIEMPASFGYLKSLAKAIKSSPNWLAIAGVTRGLVPGIDKLLVPGNVISNAIAEEMQPKFGVDNHRLSINTITNIRPYGLTIWGNRTLKPVSNEGTVALNFLNTRNMLSDIKKLLYTTAKSCMFEQNSSDLWIKFKNGIEPLLRRLKAGNGISDYQIVRGTTKYNGDPLTKGEIAAVIKIYPMYAVEYFELSVEINDEEVTVS